MYLLVILNDVLVHVFYKQKLNISFQEITYKLGTT